MKFEGAGNDAIRAAVDAERTRCLALFGEWWVSNREQMKWPVDAEHLVREMAFGAPPELPVFVTAAQWRNHFRADEP